MTARQWMGAVVVCAVAVAGAAVASAQEAASPPCGTCPIGQRAPGDAPQARQIEAAGVSFTLKTAAGTTKLRAEGWGVVFDKTADPSGTTVRVRSGEDVIDVRTRIDGRVELERNGQSVTIRRTEVRGDEEGRVQKLTQGSEALKGLTRLAVLLEQVDRPEAVAVLTSLAVVRALQGDALGNHVLARRLIQPQTVGLVRAAQRTRQGDTVDDCWAAYERVIARNYQRYSDCLMDYYYLQPMQYACGLEWAINAELAWFQLIACAGGIPIGG